MNYAELESKKIASIIINEAINKNITSNIKIDELFIITKDDKDEIKTIDFNPIMVNNLLTKTTGDIQLYLRYIENGQIDNIDFFDKIFSNYNQEKLRKGIIYEIPSGVIFGNSYLANIGPRIPVKFSLMGDIVSHVNTKITNYGINNALIEVNINLSLMEQIILPFSSGKIKIETSVPVAMKIIQGSIPNYYLNGINENSTSIALPIL